MTHSHGEVQRLRIRRRSWWVGTHSEERTAGWCLSLAGRTRKCHWRGTRGFERVRTRVPGVTLSRTYQQIAGSCLVACSIPLPYELPRRPCFQASQNCAGEPVCQQRMELTQGTAVGQQARPKRAAQQPESRLACRRRRWSKSPEEETWVLVVAMTYRFSIPATADGVEMDGEEEGGGL